MSSVPPTREILRHQFRSKRRQLSPVQQQLAAQQLLDSCLNFNPFLNARSVACYLANDGEINTEHLINYCWQQQVRLLLPILDPNNSGHLVFIEPRPSWPLQLNRYGIFEPAYQAHKVVELADIDIIFTPLVAFDPAGNRLGMGGGYYDRTLAPLNQQKASTLVIGLAHDCQQCDNLPVQAWDIPLDGIITPSRILALSRHAG